MQRRGRLAACLVGLISVLIWAGDSLATTLQGSEWKPLRMAGVPVPRETDAFIQFRSKGRLAGHSGCNRIFADYQVDNDYLFVGPVAATRMACARPLMEFEAALAGALENARTYKRVRQKLVLFDGDGSPILEMRQTDWD